MTSSKCVDQDKLNTRMLETVVSVIAKPPTQRHAQSILELAPWLCQRSAVLQHLQRDLLIKLLQFCEYQRVCKDHVIIRQGDKGDCFYIQLTGKTSLFINAVRVVDNRMPNPTTSESQPEIAECISDEWIEEWDGQGRKKMVLDRSKFGHLVRTFDAGKSFGEMALITDDAVRSASVIADEDNTDLLVIKKQLFDETLKAKQEEEFRERKSFIDQSCLFRSWSPQSKRFLEISLRKEVYPFDSYIVRQGQDVDKAGLCFITRGEAKIVINTHLHQKQNTQIVKRQANQTLSAKTREDNSMSSKRPGSSLLHEQVRIRRHEGYLAAERRLGQKTREVCVVGPGEIIGAIELMCRLKRHTQSVVTTRATEAFILDSRNIRTIYNSKQAGEILFNIVQQTLRTRSTTPTGVQIELYSWLLERLLVTHASPSFSRLPTLQDMSSLGPADGDHEAALNTDRLPRRKAKGVVSVRNEPSTTGLDVANYFHRTKVVQHNARLNRSLLKKSDSTLAAAAAASTTAGQSSASPQIQQQQQQPQPSGSVMTRDALMMVTRHAARLLPRSRRQLERLCRADPNDPTTRSLRDPHHAIHRYIQDESTNNTASASRCSRATSACIKSQIASTPGLMSRPYSAAITVNLINRPFSAVDANNGITMAATDAMPTRPHTTLATVKRAHYYAAPSRDANVPEGSDLSDGRSEDYEESESDEEDVEMMLGISDVVNDDYVRDVVFRMTHEKQCVQASRRNVVENLINQRATGGSKAPARRRLVPRATRLQRGPQGKETATQFDTETSDEALRQLEDKLHNFFNEKESELGVAIGERRTHSVVQHMKRFTVETPDDVPIPAGSVYVRPISRHRPIRSANRTHVTRRYMMPKNAYEVACEKLSYDLANQLSE